MFIKVFNHNDTAYSFSIGDFQTDSGQLVFASDRDFFLRADVKPFYDSYSEAYNAANRIVNFYPSVVRAKKMAFAMRKKAEVDRSIETDDAKPQETFVSFYSSQLQLLAARLGEIMGGGAKDAPAATKTSTKDSENEIEAFIKEVTAAIQSLDKFLEDVEKKEDRKVIEDTKSEMNRILEHANKFKDIKSGNVKTASVSKVSHDALQKIYRIAEKACTALQHMGKICIREATRNNDTYVVSLVNHETGDDVAVLDISENLHLAAVRPSVKTSETMPYNTVSFYEIVMEPVMAAVGHLEIGDDLMSLASSGSSRFFLNGTNLKNGSRSCAEVVFSGNDWGIVKKSAATPSLMVFANMTSGETDQMFKEGDLVICTNKTLTAYHGRTGVVEKITPRTDHADIRIDFGRGLNTAVLTENDIKKVR